MTSPSAPERAAARIPPLAWTIAALLAVQNAGGILLNLYITLPSDDPAAAIATIPSLALHVGNAFLLIALAVYVLVLAHRARWRTVRNLAAVLVAALAVAVEEGFAFTATQDDGFSFGMELGFLAAVLAVAGILYRTGTAGRTAPAPAVTGGTA